MPKIESEKIDCLHQPCSRPVYPRKWAPAKTCTWPYYASVFWYGGKILQSNAAAKMCTNREFRHPTHCILHTQYISHTAFKTCCWLLTADLTGSEGLAHFQIWICLGTKPVSCLLVFFILFSLRIFAFSKKKCTWFRRLVSQFMCTRRCQAGATFSKLLPRVKYRCFIRVFNILHSLVPSIPCLTTKWKNKTKTSITSWQKEKRNNNENEAPQRVNARRHQKPCRSPGSNRIPTPIRVNRFINSAKSSSSCFF